MIPPRWRKVLRDVGGNPVQTTLAVLAMAAGVSGLGAILTSYSILKRELPRTYATTHPASAILAASGIDDEAVTAARALPGVRDAEERPVIRGRVRIEGAPWAPLVLFVVRDFEDLRIDTFTFESGARPPGPGEVLLERTALQVARASTGGTITVRLPGGIERDLCVSGTVHAAGLTPAWMDHVVTGFVGWRSAARVAGSESGQMRIIVAERPLDETHIRDIAGRAGKLLDGRGATVERIEIPPPGRHPHADQMDTFLFLLGTFGLLAVLLGAFLVAHVVRTLMAAQVRQIGMMKAIGATSMQVASLYLAQVALLAAISLAVGMPLGMSVGRNYARFSASILNADLASLAVSAWVLALQGAVGIAVPLAVALWPVLRASRLTIHETLGDVGLRPFGARRLERWLARIGWLPRPLILSLRTACYRPGRLALTTAALAAGGVAFVSSLNVSAGWSHALAQDYEARHYDLEVQLSRPAPVARLADVVASIPGAERAEFWSEADTTLVNANGLEGPRVHLIGPDRGSTLLDLPILEGRWLDEAEEGSVVVNQALLARAPTLHIGGDLVLSARGMSHTWRIIGVVKELRPMPSAYARGPDVLAVSGLPKGMTRSLRIVATRHGQPDEGTLALETDQALRQAGFDALDVAALLDRRKAIEDHLVIVKSALLFAAGLVVLVGGLGLASALTLSVAERTREIGILSAIGAPPGTIAWHVVIEGVLVGLLSWCVALLAAAPATAAISSVAGRIFFGAPLAFFMSPTAVLAWLGLVVALAAIAGFIPARLACRITVREALAYE
jgi:putative ABC transport system permease protein